MPGTSLRHRHLQPEIMDQPDLDAGEHHHALEALARINRISFSPKILWRPIRRLCDQRRRSGEVRPVRVLDVATGGGDVPVRLWQTARMKGYAIEITGCDFSPVAIEHARLHASRHDAKVTFFPLDVLANPLPEGYDVICCSLFLHHLEEAQALVVLTKMRQSAAQMALVNDLSRSRLGWIAAYLGSRILTRSRTVHVDAVLSVEGSFRPREALELALKAGWAGATIHGRFPFRYLLQWSQG
jgi:2-polyprenyl-3-methyl-5-hydroxy-6-metoxy-1,4-benzoquinol methylase